MNEPTENLVEQHPKKNRILTHIVVGAILISSILYIAYRGNSMKNSSPNSSATPEISNKILLSEIATHNAKDSCWTTIDGNVYDVTKFVSMHKGGDRILAVCGIDGTDLFTGKSPMGRVHSEMAKKVLSGMQIGTLQ